MSAIAGALLPLPGPAWTGPLARARAEEAPAEVGADKTVTQHAGNAAFATVSVLATQLGSSRAARMVPGLNLGVAVLEGYNAVKSQRKGDHVVAMGHAGNATGCLSAFLEDAARLTSALTVAPSGLGLAVVGFGVIGGALGVVQGYQEIQTGLALRKTTGSARTLEMGVADFGSGALTLAGIALRTGGIAPALGTALLLGASACDLISIGVDYLGARQETKSVPARETGAQRPSL